MTDSERPRRINGLSPPYTAAQLSTWVFLPTLVLEFLFFASPLLPLAASIACSLIFFFSAAASTYFALKAMKTDPADPRICSRSETGDGHDGACAWDPNEPTKQCWICDVQVGEKSMHCKFCNKCVGHFDHHCMWLNTCVGKANYTYFFRTMVSITTMLIVHSGVQLALVLDIYLGNGMSKTKSEDWFRADATIAVVVVMCVFLLLDFIALSLILQLLLFHTRLRKEGLTTYQFIVRDNRRKREQTVMENEIREQRLVAMAKATEEGRTCDKLQLCVGGYSRKYIGITCCDPLESEARAEDGTMNGNVASDSASNGAE